MQNYFKKHFLKNNALYPVSIAKNDLDYIIFNKKFSESDNLEYLDKNAFTLSELSE